MKDITMLLKADKDLGEVVPTSSSAKWGTRRLRDIAEKKIFISLFHTHRHHTTRASIEMYYSVGAVCGEADGPHWMEVW